MPSELRYAIEKNCAYALFCAREDKRYVIEVVKQQEPNAWDAERLVTALPPAGGRVPAQGVAVRQHSRARLAQPVQVVETAILARRALRSPSTVTTTETLEPIDLMVSFEETMTIERVSVSAAAPGASAVIREPVSAPPPVEGEVIARNGHTPGHTSEVPAADDLEVAECDACGTPVVATDAFCASCGAGFQPAPPNGRTEPL